MKGETGFRQCIACGKYGRKEELLRVMRENGVFLVDPGKKHCGRSAYLCRETSCVEKAISSGRFRKAFRTALPDEVYEELREAVR